MRMLVQSLALLSVLRIQHCYELWCRLQTWLGFCVAMAVVLDTAAAQIPHIAQEFPHGTGVALKKKKKKRKKEKLSKPSHQPSHQKQ